jgi:hypothetical protein
MLLETKIIRKFNVYCKHNNINMMIRKRKTYYDLIVCNKKLFQTNFLEDYFLESRNSPYLLYNIVKDSKTCVRLKQLNRTDIPVLNIDDSAYEFAKLANYSILQYGLSCKCLEELIIKMDLIAI